MRKIYVLFTILLVSLFVGCKSTQVETESESAKLAKVLRGYFVDENNINFILKNCRGDFEIINISNGIKEYSRYNWIVNNSIYRENQGIFFSQGSQGAGHPHPLSNHTWACGKRFAIHHFFDHKQQYSIAYEIF